MYVVSGMGIRKKNKDSRGAMALITIRMITNKRIKRVNQRTRRQWVTEVYRKKNINRKIKTWKFLSRVLDPSRYDPIHHQHTSPPVETWKFIGIEKQAQEKKSLSFTNLTDLTIMIKLWNYGNENISQRNSWIHNTKVSFFLSFAVP